MDPRKQRIGEALAALDTALDAINLDHIGGRRIGYVIILSEIATTDMPPETGLGACMSNIAPRLTVEILAAQIEAIEAELRRALEAGPTH